MGDRRDGRQLDDARGARDVVGKITPTVCPRLQRIFGDTKYHNEAYEDWLTKHSDGKGRMSISSRPPGTVGFKLLLIRWVVERTFAWLGRYRRHSRD